VRDQCPINDSAVGGHVIPSDGTTLCCDSCTFISASANVQAMTPEPRKRGRPPATSRDEIAAAGLRLAGQEGVDAVSIRRLAAEIGVAPMTIYSQAATKDEIIDLMTAAALDSFEFELDPDEPWPAQLHSGFVALYQTMRANPIVVDLIAGSRAMTGPAVDCVRETLLSAMGAAGLPRQQAVDVFNTLGAYVVGVVTVETARERRAEELVAHVKSLPRGEYPVLTKAPATWARPIPSETIELGLRCLIDGLCRDLVGPSADQVFPQPSTQQGRRRSARRATRSRCP